MKEGKLSGYLGQPAIIDDRPWFTVALYGVLVALILAVFEPFQYRLNTILQLWVLLAFVLIAVGNAIGIFILLPRLFTKYYAPESWTVGRSLLNYTLFLLSGGLCTFVYDYFFLVGHTPDEYGNAMFFRIFFIDMVAAVTIALIPMCFGIFMAKNRALKHNLEAAGQLNKLLSERIGIQMTTTEKITLSGSAREDVAVNPREVLFLESSGNYVSVYYQEEGTVKHKLFRSTIKQVEEVLDTYGCFIRCHRAYIVNTDKIVNVNGNAQGYRLSLHGTELEVPVSRTYIKDLNTVLNKD